MAASSFALRRDMADGIVGSVPDPADVVERLPGSQVELLLRPGQRLSDNDDDSKPPPGGGGHLRPDRATLLRDWQRAAAPALRAPAGRSADRASTAALNRHTLTP